MSFTKGMTVKSVRERLPPLRAVLSIFLRTRVLASLFIGGLIMLLWRGFGQSAKDMQKFVCFGPSKSPFEMNHHEYNKWHAHQQTPVVFNHHTPVIVNATNVQKIDLNNIKSTTKAVENKERVLILTPLRDAAPYLPKYFDLIADLTYPHDLIDLGFLISDTTDDTLAILASEIDRIQSGGVHGLAFNSVKIVEKDFGITVGQGVEDRHSFEFQGTRRKALGKARNYLLASTLTPEHSWVYWRDVDIVESPRNILQDFIAHDKDIIVPNIWFHRYRDGNEIEGKFDYNSWVETKEGLALAATLDKDVVLAEGYKEFQTGRDHMAKHGDWRFNKDVEMQLDGVGGVSILVKADVHRSGVNFPCYAFENQAETEGFGKMAKRAGYQVIGLPNYVVWHIDTEEKPGRDGKSQ